MSASALQELHESGILPIDKIADLLNIARSSAYPYLLDRELRHSQLRTLFRHCGDQRVQQRLLADLLPGTGWVATHTQATLDLDGDGDVDLDDAVKGLLDGVALAVAAAQQTHNESKDRPRASESGRLLLESMAVLIDKAITDLATAQRVLAHVQGEQPIRRKARPVSVGLASSPGTGAAAREAGGR